MAGVADSTSGSGGGGKAMGLIFWMVIVRPPSSWMVDSRMFLAGTTKAGF